MTEEAEWIDWAGGKCPVDSETHVDVRYRGGSESFGRQAWEHDDPMPQYSCWRHHMLSDASDIIAYRVVQP